ncbi:hypothetical protein GCM10025784_09000 [Citricoccus nitrophenolicus]
MLHKLRDPGNRARRAQPALPPDMDRQCVGPDDGPAFVSGTPKVYPLGVSVKGQAEARTSSSEPQPLKNARPLLMPGDQRTPGSKAPNAHELTGRGFTTAANYKASILLTSAARAVA